MVESENCCLSQKERSWAMGREAWFVSFKCWVPTQTYSASFDHFLRSTVILKINNSSIMWFVLSPCMDTVKTSFLEYWKHILSVSKIEPPLIDPAASCIKNHVSTNNRYHFVSAPRECQNIVSKQNNCTESNVCFSLDVSQEKSEYGSYVTKHHHI